MRDPLTPSTKRYREGEYPTPKSGGPTPALIALWVVLVILSGIVGFLEWLSRGGAQ